MISVTPAHAALVSGGSTNPDREDSNDALRQADVNTDYSHGSSTTGSTGIPSRSHSTGTLASNTSAATAAESPSDPLAVASVNAMPGAVFEHPLSPDLSNRTSYFRSAVLPGVSPVSNVIFPENDDEDSSGVPDDGKPANAQNSIQTDANVAANGIPTAAHTLPSTTFRLPRAPHELSAEVVDERLRDVVSNDLRGVILAQELAKQLESTQRELEELKALQQARENGLISLLRESGQVSESLISRTLVRAKVEAGETSDSRRPGSCGWKVTLGSPGNVIPRRKPSPAKRPPLAEDLQDAMSENDFKETAQVISPTPVVNAKSSPHSRQTGSPSPGPGLAASLHERRGRQSSQSLSARLFGGFTPPSSSYLSPTSDSFHPGAVPASASPGEASPSQATSDSTAKKARANSIRSVASASSHHSNRGLSGWAGSLWSWNKNDRTRYFSDDDEEDDNASGDEAILATSTTLESKHTPTHAQQTDDLGKERTIKGRPRTLSKGSSNSASTKSNETTAATSFSFQATQSNQSLPQSEDDQFRILRKSPSAASTLMMEDTERTDRCSPTRTTPVRAFLGRRPSALHPDAALSPHSVTVPVTAASSPRTSLSGQVEPLQTSQSILQSLNVQGPTKTFSPVIHEPPPHFRAVSESASTIGKATGSVTSEVFRAPQTVSGNISEWTQTLLRSFNGPSGLPQITATASTPTSAEMDRSSSKSLSTNRSMSPRISQAQNKAALSPATILNDSTATTVRLSVSSPSSQDATSNSFGTNGASEAVPLATSELQKQKGYIASAKGTIGRALRLGGSASNKGTSSPAGTTKKPRSSKARSNSLKVVIEPALTMPATFTSFSSSSDGLSPSLANSARTDGHSQRPPMAIPLEMGTIVAPEAKPPTLSSDLADQMKDGPLVDRFGFVYDIKAGMKLLKEYRKKQEVVEESVISLDPPAAVNVEDLREAIGPSPSPTPGIETALNSAALRLEENTVPSGAHENMLTASSARVHREMPEESTSVPMQLPSNQSIRRLLSQLGEMNESVEQIQKESWDQFIKRRRKKAQRPLKDDEAASAAKARKKRLTLAEAPLSTATANFDDDQVDNQFTENLVGVASMGADKQDDKTFRHLVRSGIPIAYRPSIWAEVSGASEIREPGLYQELLTRHAGESSPCLEQIDMDTHRTFPTNVFFAGSGPGVAKLRRVLIAYSWRDPSIGYCQGMNLLAALLLLVYPDEEDAFWMLASVLERTLPSDYYSSQLLVSQADQRVLQDLIQIALPELYDHLEDLSVDLPAITFGWFLSLFTDALPIQTLLRVWDVLLVYGPISLFKIAIAIFKIHSAEIFATDSASNFYVLLTNLTSHLYSSDKLLKTAFEDLKFIKRQDVESRRLIHVADIEKELAPRQMSPDPPASTSSLPLSETLLV